jgi:DNA modification methylase
MKKLKIVYMPVDQIKPYGNNPRINTEAIKHVAKSIKEFGFRVPLTLDKDDEIVTGHTRYFAAIKEGYTELPVLRAEELTEEQIKAFRIADNKVAEYSEWDFELLTAELEGLKELNFDLDSIGFKTDELNEILSFGDGEIIEDDFNQEPPEIPISQLGDVWHLGRHRLMCGDSTSDDVLTLMNGKKADLVVTDPPYNVAVNDESVESLKKRNRRTDGLLIENDNMSEDQFKQFLKSSFDNYNKIMKEGSSIYVFYADSETINFMTAFIESDFHFAQNCIWNKQQFVMTRKDYHYKHEPCLYGWKKGKAHFWNTDRKQSSVWDFDRPFKNELHPTMKPIELISYPIKNSSKKKGVVVDLFGGSGSTLIASEQTARQCYMMELDPKYADVIVNRYINFKGSSTGVYLVRGGEKSKYSNIEKG